MFKLNLEKVEEPEIKLPTSIGSKTREKQENSKNIPTSALLSTPKPLTVWITTNWKILKEMGILDHLTYLLKFCVQVKKQVRTGHETMADSKLGKEYIKAIYYHPAYLT